ncbi:hypothetical protein TI39_contig5905g00006 [Zymoseptoria brevis]|uniref:Conserved oligomeric Golgi complex subunit 2 n=1 Tax=Zymoseptoria brevis TaxID=1047168 RepID=A0A0F4G7C9_9PEZI|nr:hypothetical protein TI39_contig5905g00006 [Zymoseptoria brevis]
MSKPHLEFPSKITTTPGPRSSTSSSTSSDDIDTLPYPAPLSRSDFLSPTFDPATYLSTLRNRHQTLEDLRSDLRSRSQLLNRELLDLVNDNYEHFLGLGDDLKGGEEKVEGVRVGVLGFRREVEGVRTGVKERAKEVRGLVEEKKRLRREVLLGRGLLEVGERVGELEGRLGVGGGVQDEDEDDVDDEEDEEEEDEEDVEGVPVKKLRRHADSYLIIRLLIEKLGPGHPFLVAQKSRLVDIRKTMLLDLAAATRKAKSVKASDAMLALVQIYADLEAQSEGIKVLKES